MFEKIMETVATSDVGNSAAVLSTYVTPYIEKPVNSWEATMYILIVTDNLRGNYNSICMVYWYDSVAPDPIQYGIRMNAAIQGRIQNCDSGSTNNIKTGATVSLYKLKDGLAW